MSPAKKILIVDDDIDLRTILHDSLTHEGFTVLTAKDGREGLEVALSQRPDLILLDIMMPEVSGLEMLKALRADEWGKQVHVFMLTTMTGSKEKSQSMQDNVSKYINKSDMKLDSLLWDIKSYLRS
jgi:DNA-binding response OmpR family regulator